MKTMQLTAKGDVGGNVTSISDFSSFLLESTKECAIDGNGHTVDRVLRRSGSIYVSESEGGYFKLHFVPSDVHVETWTGWTVVSNATEPVLGSWYDQRNREHNAVLREMRSFHAPQLREILLTAARVRNATLDTISLVRVKVRTVNSNFQKFFFLLDDGSIRQMKFDLSRRTGILSEFTVCKLDVNPFPQPKKASPEPRSLNQIEAERNAAIAAMAMQAERASKMKLEKAKQNVFDYEDDYDDYDVDDDEPKIVFKTASTTKNKNKNNPTKEKKMTTASKKEKGISSTLSMAKRAATHGAKVAATDEIGETLLVVARELTGHDFTENGDPIKNEVAKLVVATLLHAATENFDIPQGENVAAACELQIEASTRDVIQPRLKSLRPLFEQLAKLGGAAVSAPMKAAKTKPLADK